ncbi:hypothetical protein [Aeromicrobium stalagmiti]|uniref:hypothetical protein n=1 Tax=Aeromicrobium stalagmiti TaxID=2738988 RepID=UPI0015682BDE|nr:hypothetical protein [Aeromicrobium stalagmiti]NRQ50898.1 hypothetical protein [Aeromicrobium stalagmiti]
MALPLPSVRPVLLALTATAVLLLTGCGNDSPAVAPAGTVDDASAGLTSALGDVERIAVGLEQYYFQNGYPADLAGAIDTMKDAELAVSDGNTVAGYRFDESAQEFKLCVENASGAWATYDTAPMSVREAEETGGCPELG